jgi:hypothetical protein
MRSEKNQPNPLIAIASTTAPGRNGPPSAPPAPTTSADSSPRKKIVFR